MVDIVIVQYIVRIVVIKEHIEPWKQWLIHNKNYSINTLKGYSREVNEFILFLDDEKLDIKYAEKSDIQKYIKILRNKEISSASIQRRLSSLRSFFQYLEINKNISINVLNYYHIKSPPKKMIKCISEGAIEDIIMNYEHKARPKSDSEWVTTRNKTIILLMYGSGLRISEVLSIRVDDIKDDKVCILGKGNKERVVYIHVKILRWIEKYKRQIPFKLKLKDRLFVNQLQKPLDRYSFCQDFNKIKKQFNLPKEITPHSLRYSYTTHLLEAGVNIRAIQETLGHACISTTERYINVNKEHLIDVIKTKHPRNSK